MKNPVLHGILACALSGAAFVAQANGQGEAILRIGNLTLSNDAGNAYTSAHFSALRTGSVLHVDGITRYSSQVGDVDLVVSCSRPGGVTCNPLLQNYFSPFSPDAYYFYPDTYTNSDQRLTGVLIGDTPAPLSIDTRGDAGTYHVGTEGRFEGSSSADLTMTFRMASADRIHLSFSGDAYLTAWQDNSTGYRSRIASETTFEAKLINTTTGVPVFTFSPDELNLTLAPSNGVDLLDPAAGWFSITSDLLNTTDEYQLSISQIARTHGETLLPVPEPSGLAMLAAGLGLLGMTRRAQKRS